MIDTNTIIQVNATVMAGILILLTVGAYFKIINKDLTEVLRVPILTHYGAAAIMILPFAVSSIAILCEYISNQFFPATPEILIQFFQITYLVGTTSGFGYVVYVVAKMARQEREYYKHKRNFP